MDIDNTLQLFFNAVKIPISYFIKGQLLRSYNFQIQDYNLPLMLTGGLPEALPDFWYSYSPEYMYFAGLELYGGEQTVFLGSILLSECSVKQAQEVCARLGRKSRDVPVLQRYFNKIKPRDIGGMLSCLKLLGKLLREGDVTEEISCVPFHWNIPNPIKENSIETRKSSEVDQYVEEVLVSCIRTGNTNALLQSMNRLIYSETSLYGDVKLNINEMRSYNLGANMMASRAAVAAGVSYEVTSRLVGQYIDQIQSARSTSELSYLFMQCLQEYTELVAQVNELPGNSPIVKQVQQHIREHCCEKISSKDLAERFHVNLSYLCTLFKKETGMTINGCIQSEKIRKAKRLLTGSRFSVAQISETLNFSTESYFCAVFKKFTGMTPQAYRKDPQDFLTSQFPAPSFPNS